MERYIISTTLQRRTILADKGAYLTQSSVSADRYRAAIVWADTNVK